MVSIIPILLYVIILKSLDGFKLVKWKVLVLALALGAVSCGLSLLGAEVSSLYDLPFYAPLIEEILKGCAALLLFRFNRIAFMVEAMCYAGAVGAGFSLVENALYGYYNPDMLFATSLFRGLGTSVMHIGCTSLFLSIWLFSLSGMMRYGRVIALFPSLIIHGAFNAHLLSPLFQLIIVVIVFLLIFIGISSYNDRWIEKWLDHSIDNDVKMLGDIQEGRLDETPTGQYLMKVREQFDPEVFFDMLCYVQLALELKVEAKGRIMLHEAGMDDMETPEERERWNGMVKEMTALKERVGLAGMSILKPLVPISREDMKAITG